MLCGEDPGRPDAVPPGRQLHDRLAAAVVAPRDGPGIAIEPVACMAVCDRPVTLAFRGRGKWSYLVGGADPDRDIADILAAGRAVAEAPHGIPRMDDRPPFFRNGVIGRLPPAPGDP